MAYLVERPRLWMLVAIPLVLNLLIFIGLTAWGFSGFAEWLRGWLASHDAWYWVVAAWIVRVFFWAFVLLVVYFIFTPVALLIASPFNDRLAESVERACGFAIEDTRSFFRMVASEALFAVLCESKRLTIVLFVFLFLFPLNFLPGFGSAIYGALCLAWACWSAALEFTGFAADRRHVRLGAMWGLLRRHFAPTAGYGLVTVALMMIPLLNVLMVPVGAVGGTMLFGMLARAEADSSRYEPSWRG